MRKSVLSGGVALSAVLSLPASTLARTAPSRATTGGDISVVNRNPDLNRLGGVAGVALEEWKHGPAQQEGQWDVVQKAGERVNDAQAHANGFMQDFDDGDGRIMEMVSLPVLLNRKALTAHPAPGLGEHAYGPPSALGDDEEKILDLQLGGSFYDPSSLRSGSATRASRSPAMASPDSPSP